MRSLPAGTFLMGSPKDEKWRSLHERQHGVRVEAFDLARNLVTNAEFRRFQPVHCRDQHQDKGANFDGDA